MKIDIKNINNYKKQEAFYEKYKTDNELSNARIYKKLVHLEKKANQIATKYCNGDFELDEYVKFEEKIKKSLKKILDLADDDFFFNSDCRGYSLKIREKFLNKLKEENIMICTDFGGFGIIAPEF